MTPEYLSDKVRDYLAQHARTLSTDNLTYLVSMLNKLELNKGTKNNANSASDRSHWFWEVEQQAWDYAFKDWELERRKEARICIYCEVKLIPTPYDRRTGLAGECLECSTSCNNCDSGFWNKYLMKGVNNEQQ